MNILITGSAGYLGSKVVDLLQARKDFKIFGIDVRKPANENKYELFLKSSVTDRKAMSRLFEAAKPGIAVHLAFVVNSLHQRRKEDEVAIKGTKYFLENCRKHQVPKIVFMSSAAAYGAHPQASEPYTEESRLKGNAAYPYSRLKAATDRVALKFMSEHPNCHFTILRPCLFVGPNTNNSFFEVLKLPFFPQIKEHKKAQDPEFQFIHEDDMAECVLAAIEKNIQGIYNIAADGRLKLSEIAAMAGKRRVGLPPWLLYPATAFLWHCHLLGSPPGQLDFIRYPWVMDNSKMKRELYVPKYTSGEALREFLASRRKN
jgi:UDP-glucose 4-epimerase